MKQDRNSREGGDLFVVDNSDGEWKVLRYLQEWTDIANRFDIATGVFEIGGILALDGKWQQLEKVRILMGGDMTARTRRALLESLTEDITETLDESLEREKEDNDFLVGVPGVVEAMRKGQIECRVYTKDKFHAKAYITHGKLPVLGSAALVGSSNLTLPGMTQNVELNVQVRSEVETLQQWFEEHWQEAEDVTPGVLAVIDRHIREYMPFEVYAKALQEFFRGHEMTATEWEKAGAPQGSRMYGVLDQYQREGYHALLKIARKWGGALLCDGVGLGKTYIGLMLIERLAVHDRKNVALFVPPGAYEPVWQQALRRHLVNLWGNFSNFAVYKHADLHRGGDYPRLMQDIKENADVIVIDEAHHFRNPGTKGEGEKRPSRYWRMFDICEGKDVYLLTATPVNNKLTDLQHMIELFSRRQSDYFGAAPLGIHSLPGHFRSMERELDRVIESREEDAVETDTAEAREVLAGDRLVRELVVQRSRSYVKKSQKQHGEDRALFPDRKPPKVADYSIRKTYGDLLQIIEQAFNREQPLFRLAVYYPLHYYKGPDETIDPMQEGRQKQVVGLIRTLFLKRFESSAYAFMQSCRALMAKLLAWVEAHSTTESERRLLERWKAQNQDVIDFAHRLQHDLMGEQIDAEAEEDFISEELLEDVEELSRDEYKVGEIIEETRLDLDELARFLRELTDFEQAHDDKVNTLIDLLKSDPVLRDHKVLIFSEFSATARYVAKRLREAGIEGVDQVDSQDKRDRGRVIKRFAPYYNDSSTELLEEQGLEESRVLVSTDVLSEGLNLQDATRIINYDLHWNPVRLMQRIGRVDRRLDPDVEDLIAKDHPDRAELRGRIEYWNFLPPDELDRLLRLYRRVAHKTLRISKMLGIPTGKLLRPDDPYEPLRDFNHEYEGTPSALENMHLEFQELLQADQSLEGRLEHLPGKVFSGKEHPQPDSRAVFFCYALPAPEKARTGEEPEWTEEAGLAKWYLYSLPDGEITDTPEQILAFIRSEPDTPRHCKMERETLRDIRKAVEKHITNTYLKRVQAPAGVKPSLKVWMELS